MAKEHKPGWIYKYSDVLQQEIAVSEKTGWIVCEDGTKYSPSEIEKLKASQQKITAELHLIKKNFGGKLISIEESK